MLSRTPLLTLPVHESMLKAKRAGQATVICSLDLGRTTETLELQDSGWLYAGTQYPYLERCKDRTVYYWTGITFEAVARYTSSLIKLVPTEWGAPTFEIDGIKMLPTSRVSPYEDARGKVALIEPRGKVVLDTCGGLGYFASWCLQLGAASILSFEKNPDVLWLRSLNPWSPEGSDTVDQRLRVANADVSLRIADIDTASCDAVLHDPPRFAIAGELYSQDFYDELGRVIKRRGKLFHYTGMPNRLTTGRDVPNEVAKRLQRAGFATELRLDGVFGTRK